MEQITENIVVITAGEPIPEGSEEYLKIFLAGSIDLSESEEYDWQGKFIQGLVEISNPSTGLIMLKNQKFMIINPKMIPADPNPSISNPEFVNKLTWSIDMMNAADAIVCNFLMKSTSYMPLMELGYLLNSQKVIVRCSDKYINSATVKVLCEKFNIPLYPSSMSSVSNIVQGMYAYIPRFQELQKTKLPE